MKGQACRKSVRTLLEKMVSEGLIRSFEIVMPSGNSTTSFIYYCDANITMEHDIFKKAVNETKFRLKSLGKNQSFFFVKPVDANGFFVDQESVKCGYSNCIHMFALWQHTRQIFQ